MLQKPQIMWVEFTTVILWTVETETIKSHCELTLGLPRVKIDPTQNVCSGHKHFENRKKWIRSIFLETCEYLIRIIFWWGQILSTFWKIGFIGNSIKPEIKGFFPIFHLNMFFHGLHFFALAGDPRKYVWFLQYNEN